MSIVAQQRELYQEVWTTSDRYADVSPGANNVGLFLDMVAGVARAGQTVLDAGTGSGKGALALDAAGFTVTVCDLTYEGLLPEVRANRRIGSTDECSIWHDLTIYGRFDWVYCCDVLEHIPPEYTMLTISRLLDVARSGVFLSIALVPDQFGVWVGEHLHQTVQPFTWWRDRLRDMGELVECRDCLLHGVYLVRARP